MYESSYHYLLMSNHLGFQKKVMAILKPLGLSTGQPKVLDHLRYHNGASQKEIAAGCHIEAASLTSVLSRMEEKGMIERRMLNGNRRSLYVFLTDMGKELQKAVEREFDSIEKTAFERISEEERKAFMSTFFKIYENLS